MRRREFLKNSALFSASTFLYPIETSGAETGVKDLFHPLASLQLTDFEDEQDESPILLQNRKDMFLTTLRRREHPSEKEVISWFRLVDGKWQEQSPVTPAKGAYEAVSADCHPDGSPGVAWTEIDGDRWRIMAAVMTGGTFPAPAQVSDAAKRSINPVIKAVSADRFVMAWESFEEGTFCIYVSTFSSGRWSTPMLVTDRARQCFHPAIERDGEGRIYLAYDYAEGCHRNVEMKILGPGDKVTTVPIAIGGAFQDRVNLNVKPALAFDTSGRLWISWESNRFAARLQDGDNYTGDRCCGMVCYEQGRVLEQKGIGRWLFKGKNDHWPTFQKDLDGNLYLATHCGGDFVEFPFWSFRVSALDPKTGWTSPATILKTKQKGESLKPTLAFDPDGKAFWLAWKSERSMERDYDAPQRDPATTKGTARRGMLELNRFSCTPHSGEKPTLQLAPAIVEEHLPVAGFKPVMSGRPKSTRRTIQDRGETYTLLIGNLHEHSEISSCWPAGTDGTLHDDYRFGLTSEGYDFMGITDHGYSLTEIYWRKNLRLAEFYNDPPHFVVFPSMEWTLSNGKRYEIGRGVGHRNIIFATTADARKFIRNQDEVYSSKSPETANAEKLWKRIRSAGIRCIAIPHHPADAVHACCWETRDEEIEPLVEIFQCRGNAEYRGAPRMVNIARHEPTANDKAFIDYALREKKHKLGFIASGDHNNIGVGLACVWVKEVDRDGIFEALRARRVFATTGDQIKIDFRINDALQGQAIDSSSPPRLTFDIEAVDRIWRVDILRNSRVIHSIRPGDQRPEDAVTRFSAAFTDQEYSQEKDVRYYYVRVIQENEQIGWSSPVWVNG